jgi:hypothetical protein
MAVGLRAVLAQDFRDRSYAMGRLDLAGGSGMSAAHATHAYGLSCTDPV